MEKPTPKQFLLTLEATPRLLTSETPKRIFNTVVTAHSDKLRLSDIVEIKKNATERLIKETRCTHEVVVLFIYELYN